MSHWAKVDENNIVVNVLVGSNSETHDETHQWLLENHGGTWIRTSYNTREGIHALGGEPFRKNYACIGMIFDEQRDAFYWPDKPFPSWTFNEFKCCWEAPTPKPDGLYDWDESTLSWNMVE